MVVHWQDVAEVPSFDIIFIRSWLFGILKLNSKPCPYIMAVPDELIESLGGWPENAFEKKPTVAITTLHFSNECFPCVCI